MQAAVSVHACTTREPAASPAPSGHERTSIGAQPGTVQRFADCRMLHQRARRTPGKTAQQRTDRPFQGAQLRHGRSLPRFLRRVVQGFVESSVGSAGRSGSSGLFPRPVLSRPESRWHRRAHRPVDLQDQPLQTGPVRQGRPHHPQAPRRHPRRPPAGHQQRPRPRPQQRHAPCNPPSARLRRGSSVLTCLVAVPLGVRDDRAGHPFRTALDKTEEQLRFGQLHLDQQRVAVVAGQ